MEKRKSATVAGVLGVALGAFGVHNFYSGKQKVIGFIHLALGVLGFILIIVGAIVDTATQNSIVRYLGKEPVAMVICYLLGYILFIGNAIWAAVEGIIILAKGDAALSAAPAVATPAPAAASAPAAPAAAPVAVPAPAAQPVVVVQKQPMNPKTKKKIILGVGIGVGALVLLSVGAVVLALVLRVDYGETYRIAGDVKTYMYDLYSDSNCERIVDYVDSTWSSEKTYGNYVSECKKLITGDSDLVKKLGDSSAVKKDEDIKKKYDKFKEAYDAALANPSEVNAKIDLYQAYHTFIIKADNLSISRSSEKDYKDAISSLTNSGNDTLKSYGESWLTYALAYRTAYNAYWKNNSAGTAEYTALTDARKAFNDFVDDEAPDMEDLAELDFSGFTKAYSEYRTLYFAISDAYEEHYDGSGDCTESYSGKVYCD